MNPFYIALGVVGGLFLFLLLLLLLGDVRVRLRYGPEQKLRVVLSLWGIPYTLVGKKEKKPKPLKDCKDPDKLLRQEKEKYLRYTLKQREKEAKKREKARLRAAKKAQKKKDKATKKSAGVPSPGLTDNLTMILALIKRFYVVSNGRMRVKVCKLQLSIGTGDAAKTAILYGVAVQLVTCIVEWLDKVYLPIRDREKVVVVPDFVSGKIQADVDIALCMPLRHILPMAIKMYLSYNDEHTNARRRAIRRAIEKKKKEREQASPAPTK